MNWAREVMKIKPELEQLAGKPVHLHEMDYGFAVSVSIEGINRGQTFSKVHYQDPTDGEWYKLDTKIQDYLTPEQIETVNKRRFTVEEAQEALRAFIRNAIAN
jgi:hypothetical protein